MSFVGKKILITGAYRGFGKTLAAHFSDKGAELFLTVRGKQAQRETQSAFRSSAGQRVHVYDCDLTDPDAISASMTNIAKETDHIDIIVNNAAMWLDGDINDVSDEDSVNTVNSGVTGSLLIIKHLEGLLLNSSAPDIVNMISNCGIPQFKDDTAHVAFYAMKHGQSGMSQILADRLKRKGVRVISLYPPDFQNIGDDPEQWNAPEKAVFGSMLTSRELVDTIDFALTRPRSCIMTQIYFEDSRPS